MTSRSLAYLQQRAQNAIPQTAVHNTASKNHIAY